MKQGRLFLIPRAGLANRMRAIASAYTLTQKINSTLQIIWFQDWALGAPFYSIFQPSPLLSVRDATFKDKLLYSRAYKKNIWIPALPQKFLFDRRISELEISPLKEKGFDFESWAKGHQCYMTCYQVFGNFSDSLYQQLFHPVKEVMKIVDERKTQFTEHTIGLHIRRTDHTEAARRSPLSLFIKHIKQEIDTHEDSCFYLATDSNQVKQELIHLFGERIITSSEDASRDNITGIRGGLADMWTLAATQKIYCSALSSFSPMAASIGGVPLQVVDTDLISNPINCP